MPAELEPPLSRPPATAALVADETASAPQHAPSVFGALTTRVRFANRELPQWAPLLLVLLLVAATAGGLGRWTAPRPAVAAVAAPSPASRPAQAPPTLTNPPSSTPLKASGAEAVSRAAASTSAAASENTAASSARELVALAEQRRQHALGEAQSLLDELERKPASLRDKRTATKLRQLLDDPSTAASTLGTLAGLPGSAGADALYEVWTASRTRKDNAELARALLYSTDVRPKISPALAVLLDLRVATSCEQHLDAVRRAASDADRRALPLLAKLKSKRGCGANHKRDCYSCLREGSALDDAVTGAKARPAPKPW